MTELLLQLCGTWCGFLLLLAPLFQGVMCCVFTLKWETFKNTDLQIMLLQ